VGIDEDLPGGPALFVWPPTPENDKPWRKFQHLYLPLAYSLLFVVWRIDSLKVAWSRKIRHEQFCLAAHYALALAILPAPVFAGAVLLSGFMSATIVTVSHQNEDLMFEHEHDYVKNQFEATRDCRTSNPFSEWLWGGMQYQLEHHLMPTMPRYKYPALVPLVQKFAKENNIEYRELKRENPTTTAPYTPRYSVPTTPPSPGASNELQLLKDNYMLYVDVARAPADPRARESASGLTI